MNYQQHSHRQMVTRSEPQESEERRWERRNHYLMEISWKCLDSSFFVFFSTLKDKETLTHFWISMKGNKVQPHTHVAATVYTTLATIKHYTGRSHSLVLFNPGNWEEGEYISDQEFVCADSWIRPQSQQLMVRMIMQVYTEPGEGRQSWELGSGWVVWPLVGWALQAQGFVLLAEPGKKALRLLMGTHVKLYTADLTQQSLPGKEDNALFPAKLIYSTHTQTQ